MLGNSTTLAVLLALQLAATEISVGVFGLFRPETVLIQDACGLYEPVAIKESYRCDESSSVHVEIPGRIRREFRGRLRIVKRNGVLTPIVRMDLEAAVSAVLAAEMPSNTPPEALKALAVVARSFYVAGGPRHATHDFCDTTHCQFLREVPPQDHPASRATRDTAGLVVTYKESAFPAMHAASCGGKTFRAEDVGLLGGSYPYFSVRCEFCAKHQPLWKKTLTLDEARPLLQGPSESSRLAFARTHGWSALPGNHYSVTVGPHGAVFTGSSAGHGIGLCQRGAAAHASRGASFRDILRYYLPYTELRIHARVLDRYRD